jgi:L-threonylcarbamoyladenylate synthase
MHRRHYSPSTRLMLVRQGRLPQGRGAYLKLISDAAAASVVEMPADPAAYAASLYSVLHRLDGEGWDWIAVDGPPGDVEWAGVLDRLRRAASG